MDDVWRTRPTFPRGPTKTVELWEGWLFKNNLIYDSDGNHYSQRDIKLSYQAGLVIDGYFGREQNIKVLRQELERRKRLLTVPKVILVFEDENGYEEKIFDLIAYKEID